MEKRYSIKDVDKGADELAFMKQKVKTIRRKGLNQFEGQYIGSKGWFKLDIYFLTYFSKIRSEFYRALFKNNIEVQDMEVYKIFIVSFDT